MERREILKYTALLTGASVSFPLWSVILSGCNTAPSENAPIDELQFFSQEEFTLLTGLADLILPKTDSPSASDVGVHFTIDGMVGTVYKAEGQVAFRKGFRALASYLEASKEGRGWLSLETSEQLNLLQQLENSKDEDREEARKAFLNLKQQTIAYYLSTKEIATQYLTYLPVPGVYKSCISLEEAGGKAWAL
jgi:hypothetical protein